MAAATLRRKLPPPLQLKKYNLDGDPISDGLSSKDRLTPLLMKTLGHSPYKGLPEKKLTPSPVQESWVRA
ncbi:MAG: hypothetical protein JXA94_02360 [Parachlamydiales bacterium]|nr:hypothetical protein [Parachlamydiales bacterium]